MAAGIRTLWMREGQDFTITGLLLTGAVESLTCGYLSVVVSVALMAQLLLGAWWLSGVSALVLVPFLLREAREAWEGDECCHD
jgi:hypothetical protein